MLSKYLYSTRKERKTKQNRDDHSWNAVYNILGQFGKNSPYETKKAPHFVLRIDHMQHARMYNCYHIYFCRTYIRDSLFCFLRVVFANKFTTAGIYMLYHSFCISLSLSRHPILTACKNERPFLTMTKSPRSFKPVVSISTTWSSWTHMAGVVRLIW